MTLVAPPRAERGLKFSASSAVVPAIRRSASRGAWIEMLGGDTEEAARLVAPPRAERGLKLSTAILNLHTLSRSASRGAWIEILSYIHLYTSHQSLRLARSVD